MQNNFHGSQTAKAKLIIVGGGGHGAVVHEAATLSGHFSPVGVFCESTPHPSFQNVPRLAKEEEVAALLAKNEGVQFCIAVGDNCLRQELAQTWKARWNLPLATIVHPHAFVSPTAKVSAGAVVLARAHVGTFSEVGELCLVNTGASLDHDCKLELASSLAPGSFAGGNVTLGERTAVGLGASIRHGVSIGRDSVVGMAAAVTKDVESEVVVMGVPAKITKQRLRGEKYL